MMKVPLFLMTGVLAETGSGCDTAGNRRTRDRRESKTARSNRYVRSRPDPCCLGHVDKPSL